MKLLKNGVMLIALTTLTLSIAHAKPTKLPFIGSTEVNWLGGNATAEIITIKKNGTITIMGETMDGEPFYTYRGKFSNPLKITDDDGSFLYYYKFVGNKKISLLDKNKKVLKDCWSVMGGEAECTQEIEVFQY